SALQTHPAPENLVASDVNLDVPSAHPEHAIADRAGVDPATVLGAHHGELADVPRTDAGRGLAERVGAHGPLSISSTSAVRIMDAQSPNSVPDAPNREAARRAASRMRTRGSVARC